MWGPASWLQGLALHSLWRLNRAMLITVGLTEVAPWWRSSVKSAIVDLFSSVKFSVVLKECGLAGKTISKRSKIWRLSGQQMNSPFKVSRCPQLFKKTFPPCWMIYISTNLSLLHRQIRPACRSTPQLQLAHSCSHILACPVLDHLLIRRYIPGWEANNIFFFVQSGKKVRYEQATEKYKLFQQKKDRLN